MERNQFWYENFYLLFLLKLLKRLPMSLLNEMPLRSKIAIISETKTEKNCYCVHLHIIKLFGEMKTHKLGNKFEWRKNCEVEI